MDYQHNQNPWSAYDPPEKYHFLDGFLTEKREAIFGFAILAGGLWMMNGFIFGGLNLSFALALLFCTAAAAVYLRSSGRKGDWYSRTLLILSALIIPGFIRSDDIFVKFVLGNFLFVGINLGLVAMAGRLKWDPSTVYSLLEPFRSFFGLGFGKVGDSFRGIRDAVRQGGEGVKKGSAVLMGALVAIPILVIMIPLLMRSDAAFEGLLELLPEFEFDELFATAVFGFGMAAVLYSRTVALIRGDLPVPAIHRERKGIHPLTLITALSAVCALYVVYLFSQLAYFVGGFAGILPEGYSLAEYARRGFFEMAWLCVINLSLMILAIGLTRKVEGRAPLATRLLCLFIGGVTLFFVIAAGAKMVLYIGTYGMTRMRILTMVIMVFLGIATATVSAWLFLPKLPYMKILVIVALVMGCIVLWADVNSIVASYNVDAYLSGRLADIDLSHLRGLGDSAVPQLDRLAREAQNADVAKIAREMLDNWWFEEDPDLRAWNWADHLAREILKKHKGG